jgi:hypothetical protein
MNASTNLNKLTNNKNKEAVVHSNPLDKDLPDHHANIPSHT